MSDDAQRNLEQRALKNVRGLLDKMEDEERVDRKTTAKIAIAVGIAVVVLVAILVGWVAKRAEPAPNAILVLPPAKTAK